MSMAIASSSTSVPTHYKYDVFLSFRGEDTRHSFTDHLYEALRLAAISTFRDDDEIREGQQLKPEIERSITESRASIIVFSKNYAQSSWCLDELWLILELKKKCNRFVMPVFYKVDPADVRKQRGSFCIEAKDGAEGSKWTDDNVKRWKAALTEVANLKGMVVSGYETDFIVDIVDKIYCELELKLLSTPIKLTGIETRAERINSWLKYEQPGSPVLAICGMGGSGKTTLAKYIYNSNKQNFESGSFLEEIDNKPGGLLGLQKQLLRDVLGNNIMISNVSEGAFQIEKTIQRKKVLIVVDDVDDQDKLSTLFGVKVFHNTQSKIIITTRLLNIDTWFGSISYGCHVYKLKLLNDHESLELLSCHAFGSKIPMEGFKELALQLARYCEGNPLALKVLGSSLPVTTQDQQTRNNMIEIWRSRVNSLNSLKGDLDQKIQCVLQKSFESLPCDSHKELFLHIACLFIGEYAYQVEKILENDWHAKSGIMTLTNRCLLTSSGEGFARLEMHKLLQDMAKKIVRDESKDPAKRSRVWHPEESYRLLRKGDGSETIEGLVLDMGAPEQVMTSEAIKTSSLVKMKNLKFLQLRYVKLTGSYKNFPELTWFSWHGCNLKTIPPGLLMSSLVAIHMRFGHLEKFEPPMVLNSLKILNLSRSSRLVSICNLNRLPKLETLVLSYCISLTYVCKTIGDLENLSYLYVGGCSELWKDSSHQKSINQKERLKALYVCGRILKKSLFSLPESLSILNLISTRFEMLPSCIDLETLCTLDLSFCPNLKSLPRLPSMLKKLHVDWCTSLKNITFKSTRFTLDKLTYEGCFKLCEIQGLFKLASIARLDEADLEHMQWIKAYQNHRVDLVGDVITKGRILNTQMLYEYGIKSTYLQGIKDQSMATHEYTSSSEFLSFRVPFHPKKCRIQGLKVTILYRSSSSGEDKDMLPPFAKIRIKGLTWVYNPAVYCKPKVDDDVVWLSYWPTRDILDVGDEVHVNILLDNRLMVATGCGVSLVYVDDGGVEKEETRESMKGEEVIGGDLSLFEVTQGGYYLCRHNLFKSKTHDWLKWLFGDSSLYTDSRRWRVSCQSGQVPYYQWLNGFRNHEHRKIEVEVGVNFNGESEANKIQKTVLSVEGVESVLTKEDIGRLIVVGHVDPQAVATCVRKFDKVVQVLYFKVI